MLPGGLCLGEKPFPLGAHALSQQSCPRAGGDRSTKEFEVRPDEWYMYCQNKQEVHSWVMEKQIKVYVAVAFGVQGEEGGV